MIGGCFRLRLVLRHRSDLDDVIRSLNEQLADVETHLSYTEQLTQTKEVLLLSGGLKVLLLSALDQPPTFLSSSHCAIIARLEVSSLHDSITGPYREGEVH